MIQINSNMNQWLESTIAKLHTMENGGSAADAAMLHGMVTLLPVIKTRIHEHGKDSDDQTIGQYSTKPIYVNPKNSPKGFAPKGKHGQTKFKSGIREGEQHKTRYFEQGYKEFKTYIGANLLGSVNLSLTGGLSNQTIVIATDKGYGIGFMNDELYKRAEALERKYVKAIWTPTAKERTLFGEIVQEKLIELYGRD